MVLADATLMLLLIRPGTPVPGDEKGVPPTNVRERRDYLISKLENDHTKILIPTPVLSEILIRSRPGAVAVIAKLNKYSCFEICPFDALAAIEMAEMAKQELGKKKPDDPTTYAKMKFDRQIVSIAKVKKVKTIYSDDRDIYAIAKRAGINVVRIRDLPLPPSKKEGSELVGQGMLEFPEPKMEG